MDNICCVINSCFSKEIYNEKCLYQKLENIYFLANHYIGSNSKIYLINDGPIDIPIQHDKINIISSKKRLGRDVDPEKKVITGLNCFVESNYESLLWLLDDFYVFPSFVKKINECKQNIILSKFNLNENLFENFLFVKNNKNFVINLIDFLIKNNKRFDESFIVDFLYEMKLSDSETINFNLIKSFRPHKNFSTLNQEEIENFSQYDLLYQSMGFETDIYGMDTFFINKL